MNNQYAIQEKTSEHKSVLKSIKKRTWFLLVLALLAATTHEELSPLLLWPFTMALPSGFATQDILTPSIGITKSYRYSLLVTFGMIGLGVALFAGFGPELF